MEAKKKLIINVAFYAIIIAGIALAYKILLPILAPFIIGFCVASLTNYLIRKVKTENKKIQKLLSILFVIAFYVVIAWVLIGIGVKLVSELFHFFSDIPDLFQTQGGRFFEVVSQYLDKIVAPIDVEAVNTLNGIGSKIISELGQFIADFSKVAVRHIANGLAGVPGIFVSIILTLVSTFYFATDYQRITEYMKSFIPKGKREWFSKMTRYGKKTAGAFLKSYCAILVITCGELCIGFMILGVPYPGVIAIAIAIFDILPFLGTGGILLPWAAIAAIMKNYKMAIGILLLYLVITIVRNILEPKIVGHQIGLHPLATLIVMILGLKLMGVVGLILFPVTLVVIVNIKKMSKEVPPEEAVEEK